MALVLVGSMDPKKARWVDTWHHQGKWWGAGPATVSQRCCDEGHRTPRAALRHSAREKEQFELSHLPLLTPETWGGMVLAASRPSGRFANG